MQHVSVFGLGKAGLPLAMTLAEAGFVVHGVDVNRSVVDGLLKGVVPFEEPGLKDLVKKHVSKSFLPTVDGVSAVKSSTTHILLVPLFIDTKHKPDFSHLENVCKTVGKGLKKGDLVVLETTVPVGTTERLADWLSKYSKLDKSDFLVAFSPERIMTGFALSRYKEFPKPVGGTTPEATERAFSVYSKFCSKTLKVSNARTAELIKISEGVYRNVNIAIANELYKVSNDVGVDFWEVRKFARHEFCNILEPGLVGGHCIPVYPWFLINEFDVPLAKSAVSVNEGMVDFVVGEVKKRGAKVVGIVGVSWREGVKELRFSRAVDLVKELVKKKYSVVVFDPRFSSDEIAGLGAKKVDSLKSADVVFTINKLPEIVGELKVLGGKVVDLKNLLKRYE